MTNRQLPGPGSLCWQLFGQRRMLLVTGRALILEAALPAGGAALAQHSTYRTRPLHRLELTLDSLMRLVYGDANTRECEVARIGRVHRHINGTDDQGRRYDGLHDPSRTWIMLTLFDAMVAMERLAGHPLSPADEARLYDEWRPVILAFGIDESAVPRDLVACRGHVDAMLSSVLEDNTEARHLMGALYATVPPPSFLARCPAPLWHVVRVFAGAVMGCVLRADLPEPYRRTLGVTARRRDRALSRLLHGTARRVLGTQRADRKYLPLATAAMRGGPLIPGQTRRSAPAGRRRGAGEPRPVRVGRFFDDVLDQTGDGHLTREDLGAMARGVCWPLELTEASEQVVYDAFYAWWEQLAAELDTDGDGRVSRAEFLAAPLAGADGTALGLWSGLLDAMGAVFDAVDSDHSGHLDMTEYRTVFGPKLHPADLNRGFKQIDVDGDGRITRAEFLDALALYFTVRDEVEAGAQLFGRYNP
ncbi:EF-hand domain-containing protein [Streptomyces sp. NPDC002790]|uniref:EF-hand domain-containing protein n=1 Tax=Streptomyces sp. NPDC002790 TaxID=3154431 RepID=UPI0033308A71